MQSASTLGTSLHKSKSVFSVHDFEHEGIFGRYYFDTYPLGMKVENAGEISAEEKNDLEAKQEQSKKDIEQAFFTIRTNYARSRDPISNEMQEWLGIGMHSKYDGKKGIAKYGRPNVALVVALDVSGSMSCDIPSGEGDTTLTSKLDVAKYSLVSMLKQLKDNDSLGIVTFTSECQVVFPLTPWKQANAESLKQKIISLAAGGGTDLSGLFGLANSCSKQHIYTTFVGIGEDFGSELAQYISTNLKGAQYMTVRTAKEFEDIMNENFEYSIFPTIFDFTLFQDLYKIFGICLCPIGIHAQTKRLEIAKNEKNNQCSESKLTAFESMYTLDEVYGTRERGSTTDTLMTVKTLFPSNVNEEGITKGCMLLLKLKRNDNIEKNDSASVVVQNRKSQQFAAIIPPSAALNYPFEQEWFESHGVHKVIALTHYVNLCRTVVAGQTINTASGIQFRLRQKNVSSNNEGKNSDGEQLKSQVDILEAFKDYFSNKCDILKDEFMKEEIAVIDKLINQKKGNENDY
ncbi:von Willebrand factor type A domain-containing protein [Reticulomyxa filosa]|uniref:von Willebrand factor type A domain-containing protein n=1 Tax=Reticulomyxa filosa TaxID=46433 RepID=X6P153_RETFI|nr:von Willebrand factor type A domain-containing protein [Reticulomyxa filosa]|eukprot:ETO32295.1 von Willebrand factor type A domain-containing protein [Reticulomyxa filosa]